MNQDDRRTKRTVKLLTEALAKLLSQKPLKNITVMELAELADINRGTFYLHYRDVYDMVEQTENKIFERFNEIINKFDAAGDEKNLRSFLIQLLELLADNADMARCLIGANGDAAFISRLKKTIEDKFTKSYYTKLKPGCAGEYLFNFIELGCIGICEVWLNSGMREPVEQIAEITERLILGAAESV